jgi:hypothetical protein
VFASEIEQVYAAVEDDQAAGELMEPGQVSDFVLKTMCRVMGVSTLREDDDLFLQGCDR